MAGRKRKLSQDLDETIGDDGEILFSRVQDKDVLLGKVSKITKVKKKFREYKPAWEQDPQLSGWCCAKQMQDSPNFTAFCRACNTPLFNHLRTLQKHAQTKVHKSKFAEYLNDNIYQCNTAPHQSQTSSQNSTKSSLEVDEIRSSQENEELNLSLDSNFLQSRLSEGNTFFGSNENESINKQLEESFLRTSSGETTITVSTIDNVSFNSQSSMDIIEEAAHEEFDARTSINLTSGEIESITQRKDVRNTVDNSDSFNVADVSSSVMSYCESNVELSATRKSTRYYKYDPKWELEYDWIGPVIGNPQKAFCKLCAKEIVARNNVVASHDNCLRHLTEDPEEWLKTQFDAFNYQAAMTEIKLSALYVMKELPFAFANEFDAYSKVIFFDSANAAVANLDRKKMVNILRNVIAPSHIDEMVAILRENYFSVLVDECTDISGHACLCIVVRYLDKKVRRIRDVLFELVQVYDGDENVSPDSETLGAKVLDPFKRHDIPLNNILSFCSDNASVMISDKSDGKSVATYLSKEIPNLIIARCTAHLLHLCAKDAAEVLQERFGKIINAFNSYIAHSSKKKNEWQVAQEKCGVKGLIVKTPVATRFLNRFDCMLRIYERWTAAMIFFAAERTPFSKQSIEKFAGEFVLREYFLNERNRVFHLFVISVLSKLQKANLCMQYEKPIVMEKISVIKKLFLDIVSIYMNPDYIKNTAIKEIDPTDKSNFKPLEQITLEDYVNEVYQEYMKTAEEKKNFFEDCRNYVAELGKTLKKRCVLRDDIGECMICLHPVNARSEEFHNNEYQDLNALFYLCPFISEDREKEEINEEWATLAVYDLPQDMSDITEPAEFWSRLSEYIDAEGNEPFKRLAGFSLKLLIIPHANASSERVWSKLGRQKTKKRASLQFPSIRAILLSVQCIINAGGLMQFEPTYNMYLRMLLNLNDQPSKKIYEDRSTFKKSIITSKHRKNSLKEKKLASKIRKQLKLNVDEENVNSSGEEEGHTRMEEESGWTIDDVNKDEKLDVICNFEDAAIDQSCDTLRPLEIGIMENGLFENCRYYFTTIPYNTRKGREVIYYKEYTVGKYYYSKSHVTDKFRHSEFQLLFSTTYQSLEKPKWLDGEVIDTIATIYERNWKEAVFIPSITSAFLFQDEWKDGQNNSILPDDNWFMFKAVFPTKGKILVPVHRVNHWRLLVFDIDRNTIRLYDPQNVTFLEIKSEFERLMKLFGRYHRLCRSKNIVNCFTACDFELWTAEWHNSVSIEDYDKRTYQKDGDSCGVFVLYLMNVIGGAEKLDVNFDPDRRRVTMANMLLRESEDMRNICLFCFNDPKVTDNMLRCDSCNRPVHIRCIRNNDRMIESGKCELCSMQPKI